MSRNCCACHVKTTRWSWHASKVLRLPRKTRKWPPTLRLWSVKTSISCETSSNSHTFVTKNRRFFASFSYNPIFTKLQKYYFLRGFRKFSRQSPNAAPATTFDTVSCSRSPANAIHEKSTFSTSQNAACHANAKRYIAECCACHAKVTRWYWHASKVLRLPRKTRKWPPIWRLWSAKTSISCETSFKFHTSEQIFQNTSGSSPQWQWINELTTTRPRRDHDETTTTRPTRREHRSNPRPQL